MTKRTWQIINSLISNQKTKQLPEYLREGQTILTDDVETANKFNNYFNKLGPNLAKIIHVNSDKKYATYLPATDSATFQDIH